MSMQLSREQMLSAYRLMRTVRTFEERLHVIFAGGEIPGFVHLYAGQEAVAVGVCQHLTKTDMIASTHRGHGHCIAKGCDIKGMMSELFGREDGLCRGKGGSMHIADLELGMMGANGIVGGGAPLVCGAALSAKIRGSDDIAVAFIGDGGSNQGTTLESYNFASVLKLPAIFIIEDNGYGEACASAWALGGSQEQRAHGFGLHFEQVDGADFFLVHEVAGKAVKRARCGGGPTLIHVKTGRFYGHFEGDAQTYRGAGEVETLRENHDPLKIFRQRVLEAALLDEQDLDQLDAMAQEQIEQAVQDAHNAPYPSSAQLLEDVYTNY